MMESYMNDRTIYGETIKISDRKLGDEWKDWTGRITDCKTPEQSGKRLYLCIMLLAIMGAGLLLFLIWYLVGPRLQQLGSWAPAAAGIGFSIVWAGLFLWYILIVVSLLFNKHLSVTIGKREFLITKTIPLVSRLAKRIGVSKDRVGNSFVKVVNNLVKMSAKKVHPCDLMILLPRCLNKEYIETITNCSRSLHIPTFVVAGGSKARELIRKNKPEAIIGVACERDLVSGIQDVLNSVPVIGIPNKRPEGPCKNTIIDLEEMEIAIQVFLGKPLPEHLTLPSNS